MYYYWYHVNWKVKRTPSPLLVYTNNVFILRCNDSLRCVGPQQQLKQRFGQGYTLKVNFDPGQTESVEQLLREMVPSAQLLEDFVGNRTYQIPSKDIVISELFEQMQARQESVGSYLHAISYVHACYRHVTKVTLFSATFLCLT